MRPIERIDNFLSKVDWKWLLHTYWHDVAKTSDIDWYVTTEDLRKEWMNNPDMRIGQLLINLTVIEDNMKVWLAEEADILAAQGLPPEQYLTWTSNYDKDMNPIPPKVKMVCDLDTDHIENIKAFFKALDRQLPEIYIKAFDNVLNSRKNE